MLDTNIHSSVYVNQEHLIPLLFNNFQDLEKIGIDPSEMKRGLCYAFSGQFIHDALMGKIDKFVQRNEKLSKKELTVNQAKNYFYELFYLFGNGKNQPTTSPYYFEPHFPQNRFDLILKQMKLAKGQQDPCIYLTQEFGCPVDLNSMVDIVKSTIESNPNKAIMLSGPTHACAIYVHPDANTFTYYNSSYSTGPLTTEVDRTYLKKLLYNSFLQHKEDTHGTYNGQLIKFNMEVFEKKDNPETNEELESRKKAIAQKNKELLKKYYDVSRLIKLKETVIKMIGATYSNFNIYEHIASAGHVAQIRHFFKFLQVNKIINEKELNSFKHKCFLNALVNLRYELIDWFINKKQWGEIICDESVLVKLIKYKKNELIKTLISNELIDKNLLSQNNLLQHAVKSNNSELVDILIEYTNGDLCGQDGQDLIVLAAKLGLSNMVKQLFEYGAKINNVSEKKQNAFQVALMFKKYDTALKIARIVNDFFDAHQALEMYTQLVCHQSFKCSKLVLSSGELEDKVVTTLLESMINQGQMIRAVILTNYIPPEQRKRIDNEVLAKIKKSSDIEINKDFSVLKICLKESNDKFMNAILDENPEFLSEKIINTNKDRVENLLDYGLRHQANILIVNDLCRKGLRPSLPVSESQYISDLFSHALKMDFYSIPKMLLLQNFKYFGQQLGERQFNNLVKKACGRRDNVFLSQLLNLSNSQSFNLTEKTTDALHVFLIKNDQLPMYKEIETFGIKGSHTKEELIELAKKYQAKKVLNYLTVPDINEPKAKSSAHRGKWLFGWF